MQSKTIRSKNNYFLKMEDDLTFFEKGRQPNFFWKYIMQLKTIQSKIKDCGTAPGNLVFQISQQYTTTTQWYAYVEDNNYYFGEFCWFPTKRESHWVTNQMPASKFESQTRLGTSASCWYFPFLAPPPLTCWLQRSSIFNHSSTTPS